MILITVALMTAMVPQLDTPSATTVRRLVDELRADLEAIPDHRGRRGRVHPGRICDGAGGEGLD